MAAGPKGKDGFSRTRFSGNGCPPRSGWACRRDAAGGRWTGQAGGRVFRYRLVAGGGRAVFFLSGLSLGDCRLSFGGGCGFPVLKKGMAGQSAFAGAVFSLSRGSPAGFRVVAKVWRKGRLSRVLWSPFLGDCRGISLVGRAGFFPAVPASVPFRAIALPEGNAGGEKGFRDDIQRVWFRDVLDWVSGRYFRHMPDKKAL